MADLRTATVARLIAAATAAADRIFWVEVPQGTAKPYVRLQVPGGERVQYLKGYQGSQLTRVQVDCFAESYAEALAIAEAIIAAMAAPSTTAGTRFGRTVAGEPGDFGEDVPGGVFVHRSSVDLLIEHAPA